MACWGDRHAQRRRVHLAGQQQYADTYSGIDAMVRAALRDSRIGAKLRFSPTNYNYGQVVLEPSSRRSYYYFTSTISASIARADIAGHANFHAIGGGAITQATEATLGGVQGASALQAISSSGTDILGWTINRLQQLLSVSLPTMAQSDIDNATTGRKAVTGALIADNAGGGGGGTNPDTKLKLRTRPTRRSDRSSGDTTVSARDSGLRVRRRRDWPCSGGHLAGWRRRTRRALLATSDFDSEIPAHGTF